MMPNLLNVYKRIQLTDTCWLWTGSCSNKGYPAITWGWNENKHTKRVHRLVYEMFYGTIPGSHEVDHVCRIRNCVNPAHLEAVTHLENCRRRPSTLVTQCKNGHDYAKSAEIINGKRRCRECARKANREYMRRRKAAYRATHPILPVTHCKRGHPFNEANTYTSKDGHRHCKACGVVRLRRRYQTQHPNSRRHNMKHDPIKQYIGVSPEGEASS